MNFEQGAGSGALLLLLVLLILQMALATWALAPRAIRNVPDRATLANRKHLRCAAFAVAKLQP